MYSFKRVIAQEPNAVAAALMALLNVFVMTGVVSWGGDVVAGVNTALVLVLGLFYVRPLSVSKSGLEEIKNG